MIYDKSQTIESFLDAAGARQPAPGGGSVTALAGALASTMGEMVVNYSIGKKGLEADQDALKQALTELHRARQMLLQLMLEDQAGYQSFTEIRKLPRSDPQRQAKFDAALLACIRIPQAIGATAHAVLELCAQLVDRVNKYLLSDLAVCAELSMATIRCAAYNVRVNLADVADPSERDRFEQRTEALVRSATPTIRDTIQRIWKRQGSD